MEKRVSLVELAGVLSKVSYEDDSVIELLESIVITPNLIGNLKKLLIDTHKFVGLVEQVAETERLKDKWSF